jgi:uncharacterized protein (TIGR02284 family)
MPDTDRFETIARMLVDSQKGYTEAAEIAEDPQIQQMFANRARERAMLVQQFEGLLPGLSGRQDEGSFAGTAHRGFINLRRLVQDDTRVALSEVERGERALVEAIEEGLDDTSIAGAHRTLLSSLYDQVRQDHDQFAAMKATF